MSSRAVVTGLRSVDFGLADLDAAVRFYEDTWGLRVAHAERDSVYLRGTGPYCHCLALHRRETSALLRIDLNTACEDDVDALHAAVRAAGVAAVEAPARITEHGGGLAAVGFVISAHTFGMYALAPLSGCVRTMGCRDS